MKLFYIKWKKTVCLSMITALLLMGVKGAYYGFGSIPSCAISTLRSAALEACCPVACSGVVDYGFGTDTPTKFCCATGSGDDAAQLSEERNEISFGYTHMLETICSTKNIILQGTARVTVEPAGAEIYRAKVKSNGKDGKFKKIGDCKDITPSEYLKDGEHWTLHYQDNTVKTGDAYAYKCKVYCKTEEGAYQYQEGYSSITRGAAAKTVGKYTCKVIKSTAKKLIVKLTGKSKNNGPLESYYSFGYGAHQAELRYKNEGEDEIRRDLECIKYSYNGKKWHEGIFKIKGKQSIYLYFIERIKIGPVHNIKISNYQYAQMFFWSVQYNLLHDVRYPQIRFNLSSGTAAVSDFISYGGNYREAFVWDDDIFERNYEDIDYPG